MPAKPSARSALTTLPEEFGGAEFGDERLSRRLQQVVEAAIKNPASSFPQMASSDAELEGTYRFLNNEAVTPERILAPHRRATCERISRAGVALVLHDTSTFTFGGEEREDLGWVSNRSVGFYAHFALAISAEVAHQPLGVMGMTVISRSKKWGENENGEKTKKEIEREQRDNPAREFLRWADLVENVEAQLGPGKVIHVMDREGDSYELFASMIQSGARFVVRMSQDRVLVAPSWPTDPRTVASALAQSKDVVERVVPISARPATGRTAQRKKIFPPRAARMAKLRFRAATMRLKRPVDQRGPGLPDSLSVNVVDVREFDTPAGEEPVEWRLVTTEPVTMPDQVAAVVDHYRGRWIIEEFFKALKTGCAAEERQLESKRAVLNAIAVLAPVAWRLLTLRSLARDASDSPAAVALTPTQLRLLQVKSVRVKLGSAPTVREAMLAVAGLGGHLKRNGEPGWLTLTRGFHELLLMEAGCLAERLSRRRTKLERQMQENG